MRNLKRALSLALATVMTIGMMVVGTGASYADVKATDNVEAIEVLQAVGIMTGDENGDFNPDANVTRNEIAVIMSNLLNLDYDYYRGTNPFTDVPSWAAPYVAACYAEGVTAGAGNGLYNGAGNVTAAEASLMIMKALGYFQYQNDFGDDWQIATIRQASYINLFDGINANAETALTRNQIAQLVLNGLKANMVTFTGSVGATIGDVVIGYVPEYTAQTNANSKYNRIDVGTTNIASDDKYFVQLGEELYNGDLRLTASTDAFGRPARYWEYDGKEIGTYVNDSLLIQEYTTEVTGDTLYDLLTRNTVNEYDLTVVVNGIYREDASSSYIGQWFEKKEINRNNDDGLGSTGNGVLTQVFVDNDDKEITVTIIDTYLALANKDYDSKKDEISFDVYGINYVGTEYYKGKDNLSSAIKVSGEDFDIADLSKDDAVLVTVADGEIQTISDCEVIAGTTIDAFETTANDGGSGDPKAVEIDGTEYKFASTAEFDVDVMQYYTGTNATNLKDLTYNVYMDAYGYVVGIEEVEKVNNYVFITGIDLNGSNLGARTATANAIFLDGTMKTIDINWNKSDMDSSLSGTEGDPVYNVWCTYTVNSSDVYTLNEVSNVRLGNAYQPNGTTVKYAQYQDSFSGAGVEREINDRYISVAGAPASQSYTRVYGTDETVYLTVDVKELQDPTTRAYYGIVDSVESVVTGIGNANLIVWSQEDAADEAEKAVHNGNLSNNITAMGNVSNGVYPLYNDKGDMVAAVVVGEDAGSSQNLVYVHSGAIYRESYNTTTGQFTWSRKVVSNGQEVILTEVGEGTGYLEKMVKGGWYQVKYNAEGNVIETELYNVALDGDGVGGDWEYVTDKANIHQAVAAEDTVLYYGVTNPVSSNNLKLVGKTLWLDNTQTEGFRVAEDVNVVLIQYNNNVEKTYFESGVSSLENIVSELNERHDPRTGTPHNYIISAIIEKGVATSIIIDDDSKACDPYTDGNWDNQKTGTLDLTGLAFKSTGMEISFYNETGNSIASGSKVEVVVRDANGTRVTYEKNVNIGSAIADGDPATIQFSYDQIPTTAGKYSVELTITDGAGKVIATGTANLANV